MWGTPLEYGEVVEKGRRPGKRMPPVDPLVPWVRRVLGISDQEEAESVAFVIARSIAVRGFEGVHMFEAAWDDNERWAQSQLGTISVRVAERVKREP